MYNGPQTLFTADFMGSNNRLVGKVAQVADGKALLEGEGWKLWGRARPSTKNGGEGTGMIRLERVKIAQGPGENRVEPELTTSMFLGDKWEHVFHLGKTMLRAHGPTHLERGKHWVELPREDLWVF
jgi:iron(III) transport system ATP-binding protein